MWWQFLTSMYLFHKKNPRRFWVKPAYGSKRPQFHIMWRIWWRLPKKSKWETWGGCCLVGAILKAVWGPNSSNVRCNFRHFVDVCVAVAAVVDGTSRGTGDGTGDGWVTHGCFLRGNGGLGLEGQCLGGSRRGGRGTRHGVRSHLGQIPLDKTLYNFHLLQESKWQVTQWNQNEKFFKCNIF